VQIGAFFWPSLLPGMIPLWQLSNSEAGWITAGFYGAYMVSVPVHRLLHPHAGDERVTRLGRRLPWIRGAQVPVLAPRVCCRPPLSLPGSG
jgi:hypothetical protein